MRLSRSLVSLSVFAMMPFSSFAATGDTTALPGEYATVSCSSQKYFTDNACTLCFEGGNVKPGQRLTGLFDTWTNTSGGTQVMYKDEQVMPTLVNIGASANTKWTAVPTDPTKMWIYTPEIIWLNSTVAAGKQEFLIGSGQKVKFIQMDLGAGYTLLNSDAKGGDTIGMVKFPLYYHDRNVQSSTDGEKQAHFECVAFKYSAPATPPTTPTTPPTPGEVTKPETGPETPILIAAALFIAFGLMFSLKKRHA